MKTRDLAATPPPVHVHVPETTPVYVHLRRRRSPGKSPQNRTKEVQVKGDGGKPKARSPWIPPGRLSRRKSVELNKCQDQRGRGQHQSESVNRRQQEDETPAESNLCLLLREQEDIQCLKRSDCQGQHRDADLLLRALVEAEVDGVAVANQLSALKETVTSLTKEKQLSKSHTASVGRQQELLLHKIHMFDQSNQSLRQLLRERGGHERESLLWSEHTDALKQRLTDSEAENSRLQAKLANKEKEASKLAEHLDFEKDSVKTSDELSRILESKRDHLETQLNRVEDEKSRLAAHIQRMQQNQQQQHQELHTLQKELLAQRQRRNDDHEWEALTRLTQHAERAEESVRELAGKLHEKESELARVLSTSSDWCLRHSREAAAKVKLEEEVAALRLQVTEANAQLRLVEERSRAEREELRKQMHHVSAENASNKLENQTLKAESSSCEEKVRLLQSEARQLKLSIKKLENVVEKYKKKVQEARQEADDLCLKLQETQQETREVQESLEQEKERVRRELLARLRELETMPDRLRRAEQQLRDAQQEADAHQRRNMEHCSALSEVEQQGAQLQTYQQRNLLLQEENDVLTEKTHNLERKLEKMKSENRDMCDTVTSQDDIQQQLEDKTLECSVLTRQLQQTVDDAQRQVDDGVHKVLVKERVSQSKVLDLQSQLSRAKSELSQQQRSKEQMENRFQTHLQNLKDRLDQSDCTNRTLQNYIHFLKTSYGNVFGDSWVGS
ncbi:outer dense fiber protein 2-like isoform X2 [Solea solea]|uniref:outer dense fiber protein 2-like isoform X2 n=1 Tax=Solea solea TaxID=90069 RepID=UPI00272AB232|nr:outer dense fiber protein 2-like isoform X2 [Solea solea]